MGISKSTIRLLLCSLALACAGCMGSSSQGTGVSATPAHLAAAESLLASVAPNKTKYQHRPSEVHWATAEREAECRTDCSGLINAVLQRGYGFDADGLANWLGARRPLASHYFKTISAERGFMQVRKAGEIRAGDVIAMRYPPGSGNTGHAMIAEGPATRLTDRPPVVPGTKQWSVPIVDSTSSVHGRGDSRIAPDGSTRSGLGRGDFRVYTDARGEPVGWAWSRSEKAAYRTMNERPMVIGRVSEGAIAQVTSRPVVPERVPEASDDPD